MASRVGISDFLHPAVDRCLSLYVDNPSTLQAYITARAVTGVEEIARPCQDCAARNLLLNVLALGLTMGGFLSSDRTGHELHL